MVDSVKVTSHNSYGSRVKNSFSKILTGFWCVVAAIFLLYRNEKNYAETKDAYNEASKLVQEWNAEHIDSSLDWTLIHTSWKAVSSDSELSDPLFWITTNDLKLYRNIEIYQRVEDERETCTDNYWWSEDCETTYTYSKKWTDEKIDSSDFYQEEWHENTSPYNYESENWEKWNITLWEFTLTSSFTNQLSSEKEISLNNQTITISSFEDNRWWVKVEESNVSQEEKSEEKEVIACTEEEKLAQQCNLNLDYVCGIDNVTYDNSCFACVKVWSYTEWTCEEKDQTTSENQTSESKKTDKIYEYHVYNNYIYVWEKPNEPEIWDMKITFTSVPEDNVSIIWKQSWKELMWYRTKNWKSVALLSYGTVSAEDMIAEAQENNKTMAWIIRLLGFILMYIWFATMLWFIETLAKILPPLASLVWIWTGIIAFALTLIVWWLTVAISWLLINPIISVCLLVLVVWWILLLKNLKKTKTSESTIHQHTEEKTE